MQAVLRLNDADEMNILAQVSPVVIAATGWFLAQVSGLDPSIANLIGNGVTVAVLCWYVIYDTRYRTPGMLQAFRQEQDESRRAFKEEQADSRETWTRNIEAIRSTFAHEQTAIRAEHKEDRTVIGIKHADEINHWRTMVRDLMDAFRDAVHDVKNTAHLTVSKADEVVQIAKKKGDL